MSDTPYVTFEASRHVDFPYPFVNIRMKSGDIIRGYVVPEHLKDKLPTPYDGVPMWTNPLLEADVKHEKRP